MKIAYVSSGVEPTIHSFSGTPFYIKKSLSDSGHTVEFIGNLNSKNPLLCKIKEKVYKKILSKEYYCDREPFVQKSYGIQLKNQINKGQFNLIFCQGTIPISHLNSDIPIVFWTDATFAGMVNFYPEFSNLSRETLQNGNRLEKMALERCTLAFYASEWAAQTALDNYHISSEKINVIPFGANIECDRDLDWITKNAHNKSFDKCILLFIGVDWQRKGGDIAFRTAKQLNELGLPTELHVVGCRPSFATPSYVKVHGFLSKQNNFDSQLLDQLFKDSHFLIIPSQAECYGIVFAEASSYGLPSIATNVGGITSAIRDGVNGKTFSILLEPEEYANYIFELVRAKESYIDLSKKSFEEFSNNLNWKTSISKFNGFVEKLR